MKIVYSKYSRQFEKQLLNYLMQEYQNTSYTKTTLYRVVQKSCSPTFLAVKIENLDFFFFWNVQVAIKAMFPLLFFVYP